MINRKEIIDNSCKWLAFSGIQNIDDNNQYYGGINSWYSPDKCSYDFIYTEITGYQLSTLVEAYNRTKDYVYIDQAILAANWIINQALQKNGGVITRRYYNESNDRFSEKNGLLCVFDSGMCLTGLMNLYSITKQDNLLKVSIKIADFIISSIDNSGKIYPLFDTKKKIFLCSTESWSTQAATFLSKVCIGLYKLYTVTKDDKYISSINIVMDDVIRCQKSDGRFITNFNSGVTHVHPHCYTTEALIFLHSCNKNIVYKDAINLSVDWLDNHINNYSECISSIVDKNCNSNKCERSDILSQILRIFLYARNTRISNNSSIDNNILLLIKKLHQYQSQSNIKNEFGGIFYGVHEDGKVVNDINSWSTQFFMQAFFWLDQDISGDKINVEFYV